MSNCQSQQISWTSVKLHEMRLQVARKLHMHPESWSVGGFRIRSAIIIVATFTRAFNENPLFIFILLFWKPKQ